MKTKQATAEVPAGAEFLRPAAAAVLLGIGRTRLWQLRRFDPTFPTPARLGARAIAFRRSELLDWATKQQA